MIERIDVTYRIKCDKCGTEHILCFDKYSPIRDPWEDYWKDRHWLKDDDSGHTFCCINCRISYKEARA